MTAPALTNHILRQGKALVRATEALGTIEPSDPIEHFTTGQHMAAYKRQACGTEEVLNAEGY